MNKFIKPIINDSNNKRLIISFQGFNTHAIQNHYKKYKITKLDLLVNSDQPYYMYRTLSDDTENNYLFVRDPYNTWYLNIVEPILYTIKQIISILNDPEVICLGQSAGGYAAILFGSLLKCSKIVSITPQIVAFTSYLTDYRKEMYKKYELYNFAYRDLSTLQPFTPQITIITSTNINDLQQLRRLNLKDPQITLKIINTPDHNLIPAIGKDRFIKLVKSYIKK